MEFPRKISCLSAMIMFCLSGGAAFADTTIQPVNGNINLAANNVPVVNINQPGQDGVSHNQYSQFDVGSQGVVLNNAQSAVQSQLAGAVNANPNLGAGAAKVILNEINSSDRTLLNGMIEVAGQKADVIVANRSGITCNGCGFINTGTGVLTTGELQFKDKQFTGYNVTGGTVAFEGKGLQKGDVDYTAVIARAENINAAVRAKTLLVLAGKKNVKADLTGYTNLESKDRAPEVLVDVSQLGGMYAGKITLIADEKGVGVNSSNNGNNNVGNNTGNNNGNNNVNIGGNNGSAKSPISLKNQGELVTDGGDLMLSTTSIVNKGTLLSGANSFIQTTSLENTGEIKANDSAHFRTTLLKNDNVISAENNVTISTTSVENSRNGQVIARNGGIALKNTAFSNSGNIQARHEITNSGTSFANSGTLISSQGDITSSGTSFSNTGSLVASKGAITSSGTSFYNTGNIQADKNINWKGTSFYNQGKITSTQGSVFNNGRDINKPVVVSPPQQYPWWYPRW